MNNILGVSTEVVVKRHKRVYVAYPLVVILATSCVLSFVYGSNALVKKHDFLSLLLFSIMPILVVLPALVYILRWCEYTRYKLYKLSKVSTVTVYYGKTISEMVLNSNLDDLYYLDYFKSTILYKRSRYSKRFLKSLGDKDLGYTLKLFTHLYRLSTLKQLLLFSELGVSSSSNAISVYTIRSYTGIRVISVELVDKEVKR